MNNRIPQQSQMYENRRDMESNSIPHSNLRSDSPSGYRWLSSAVASGSAVSLVAEATGVSVGDGLVGTGLATGEAVSTGTAVAVASMVNVTPGDGLGMPTVGSEVDVGVALGDGVSTGTDWNNPEFATESVRQKSATSTSDASTSGLILSAPRTSCRILCPSSGLFIGRSNKSFHSRLAKRRVLYQICQAFAKPSARAVSPL